MMVSNVFYSPLITLEQIEREYIERALEHFNGDKRKASKALGISYQTIKNKLDHWSGENRLRSNWKHSESLELPKGESLELPKGNL